MYLQEEIFSCRNCAIHIADCRDLFAMSKHGVQSQYCNSGKAIEKMSSISCECNLSVYFLFSAGYIHETNTLYQVNKQNILYNGSPSTEYSWFPG